MSQDLQKIWYNLFPEKPVDKNSRELIKVYNIDQAQEEIANLIASKQTFDVTETVNTVKILHYQEGKEVLYWYLENTKSEYFLIMLNRLKKEILERTEKVLACQCSDKISNINYYKFSRSINEMTQDAGSIYELRNVKEADISTAYYRGLYVLGFCSKQLYLDIVKTMSKNDRLRLLGCIATVKIFKQYLNGVCIYEPEPMKNPVLRSAWFKVCNYIDTALIELKGRLGKDFLFYWVDGIYFKYDGTKDDYKEAEFWHSIRQISYIFDVEFKVIDIPLFELLNKGHYVEIKVHKPNGKIKRFFPNKKQVRSYNIVDLNEIENFK